MGGFRVIVDPLAPRVGLFPKNLCHFLNAYNFDKRHHILPIPIIQRRLHDRVGRESIIVLGIPNQVLSFFDKIGKRAARILLHSIAP